MAFSLPRLTRQAASGVVRRLRSLRSDRQGNIALTFGLLSVPLIFGVGVSFDYLRAYGIRDRMQSDLDAAIIAAVRDVDTLTEDNIKARVKVWYNAQGKSADVAYAIDTDTIAISKTNRTIQATVTAVVPTTLLRVANINSVNVQVAAAVSGPSTQYLNVYIVLDKSASMLLAATSAGQTTMMNKTGCNFACHEKEGGPWTVNGKSYALRYDVAKAMGVTLRADVSVTAAQEVLDLIKAADPTGNRIKVGFYTLGSTATEVLKPTNTMTKATDALKTDALTSATSIPYSYFKDSLSALTNYVGIAGDGSSADAPLKLVLILTDGVISERNYVLWDQLPHNNILNWQANQSESVKRNSQKLVTPFNPDWCKAMKTSKATVGVLYTEYLAIPTDWGYNETIGSSIGSSRYTSTWGGTIKAGASTSMSRRDYIPIALQDCATSSDLFVSAADQTAIESGLASIFNQYLGSVRLTQ